MIIQNSTDIKTEYFVDEHGDIAPVDVKYEKHTINPNGLIQLRNIPSIHTVFCINGKEGITVVTYNKAESILDKYDFTVDYANGILTFHNSQVGKEIQVSYTNAIGRLMISSDRIFTKTDNQGNVIQTLNTLIEEGKTTLSNLEAIGGVFKVIEELKGYSEYAKQLSPTIIEASDSTKELKKADDNAKETNTNLNSTIDIANKTMENINTWVETHSDIVDLDNRVDAVSTQLEQNKNELTNKINEVATKGTTTEVLESTTEAYIQNKIDDGTIAKLTLDYDELDITILDLLDNSLIKADITKVECNEVEKSKVSCDDSNFSYIGTETNSLAPVITDDNIKRVLFTYTGKNYQIFLGKNESGIATMSISNTYFGSIYNRVASSYERIYTNEEKHTLYEGDQIMVEIENNKVFIYKKNSTKYTLIYEKEIPSNSYAYNNNKIGLMLHGIQETAIAYKNVKFLYEDIKENINSFVEPKILEENVKTLKKAKNYIFSDVIGFSKELCSFYEYDSDRGDYTNVIIDENGSINYKGANSLTNLPSVIFSQVSAIEFKAIDSYQLFLGNNEVGYTTLNLKNGNVYNRTLSTGIVGSVIFNVENINFELNDIIEVVMSNNLFYLKNKTKNTSTEFTLTEECYAYNNMQLGLTCHYNLSESKYSDIILYYEKLNDKLNEKIDEKISNEINRLKNKTWLTLGDSISARGWYQELIKNITGINYINYGIGGTTIAKKNSNDTTAMSVRYTNMQDECDIVTAWGLINDFGFDYGSLGGIEIGTFQDETADTFYGAMKILIKGLCTKYKGKKIGFIITTPISKERGMFSKNAKGYYLKDYINAAIEVLEYYSIPYLNLFKESGFNEFNIDIMTSNKAQTESDGLHPSMVGFNFIIYKIINFLLNL